MTRAVKCLTISSALMAAAACTPQHSVGLQGDPRPKPPFADSIEQMVPRLMRQAQVPGTAVALVEDGVVVWSQGFGYEDREARTPMTGQSVFQVASISKSVAAWGVMTLVEHGKLALDTPVEQYLTRWHLPTSDSGVYRDDVTVRRLLSHTAGLSLHGYPGFDPDSGPLPTLEASLSGETNGAGDVHIEFRPGTRWEYSGGGYTLLQLLVEERSGLSFTDYMAQSVLEPLGMHNSSYDWLPALQPHTAAAYDRLGRRLPNYRFTELAAAGLYTTAEDLARFVAAGMRGPHGEQPGRGVVRPETVELMYTPAPHSETRNGAYGLGHQLDTLANGTRVVMHGGSNRGWQLIWASIPSRRVGLVVLTNSDRGPAVYGPVLCAWYRVEGRSPAASGCRG
jgi:CubicO group peptidase (beta-lactamase class C family)